MPIRSLPAVFHGRFAIAKGFFELFPGIQSLDTGIKAGEGAAVNSGVFGFCFFDYQIIWLEFLLIFLWHVLRT